MQYRNRTLSKLNKITYAFGKTPAICLKKKKQHKICDGNEIELHDFFMF